MHKFIPIAYAEVLEQFCSQQGDIELGQIVLILQYYSGFATTQKHQHYEQPTHRN